MVREIAIRNTDLVALVDDDDFDLVSGRKWYIAQGYAISPKPQPTVRMHRLIIGAEQSIQVDHINCDRLDNRRSNLRLATASQNRMNLRRRADNTSGFRGVHWHSRHQKWNASIKGEGIRRISLGDFNDPASAALAYDDAARRLHGEFARLNFPLPDELSA